MPLKLFERLAREVFPWTESLALSCGAEPLMHKEFPAFLEILRRHPVPVSSFMTNGTLLDRDMIEAIIFSGITFLGISMDGATEETYEAIRQGARLKRVVENIEFLQDMKAFYHSPTPRLEINFVLMKSNIEELPEMVALAKDLGTEHLNCVHLTPYKGLGMAEESLYYHKDLANKYLREARIMAMRKGLYLTSPPDFGEGPKPQVSRLKCTYPWHWAIIQPQGGIFPCGWWYEDRPFGLLPTQTFKDVWYGEAFKRLRESLRCGALEERCQKCPTAGAGNIDDPSAFQEFDNSWA